MEQLLAMFADPKMRMVWILAGMIVLFIALVARLAPKPKDQMPIRMAVQQATGIRPIKLSFATPSFFVFVFGMICFFSGMLLHIYSISNRHGQSILGWLLIAIFLLSGLFFKNMRTRGPWQVIERLRRADYDGALAQADRLVRWFPERSLFHDLRGAVLRYAGRLEEAEKAYRTGIGIGLAKPGLVEALYLENLGDVMLDLRRFRDAAQVFEASTKILPQHSGGYNGLAEVLLRQDRDAERVLELVDKATQLKESNPRMRNIDRHNLANMWANRALALAMLGRMDEATSAVAKANDESDPVFIPGLAGTHWRCGLALLRMDQPSQAMEQFRKAAEMDPVGLYGKLGASGLREGVALIK